jgi:membrane protein YqaA with SNARE-associated domain
MPVQSPPETSPPAESTASVEAHAAPKVHRWALHRRLYDWVLSLAHHRHSTRALFLLSFAESSFFPIPPDVLQIALTLERQNRAWWYATVSTFASVLGAVAGYLIGWGLWHALADFFFRYIPGFTPAVFEQVRQLYQDYDALIVFTAAFTPIPYKVFTIAGGVCSVSIPMFLLASLVGRGARFFLVAALLWRFGPPIRAFVERYFNLLTTVFTLLLIGGIVAVKFFK